MIILPTLVILATFVYGIAYSIAEGEKRANLRGQTDEIV